MRILSIEDRPGAGAGDVRPLVDAGHDIARCHAEGAPAFPCAGLLGDCPIEEPAGIDVVVDSRSAPGDRTAADEAGASCALRRGIPVLVSGADNPFADWATVRRDGEPIVDACRRAIDEGAARRAAPLRAEVERILADEAQPGGAEVRITRCGTTARIAIEVPGPVSPALAGAVAARVHAVDRRRPSPESTLDIGVTSRRSP